MIQQNYGKHIGDDGDAVFRSYVGAANEVERTMSKPTPLPEPLRGERGKYATGLVVPAGIEPALPT